MKSLHKSYESLIKEEVPKYGSTFLEWYKENRLIKKDEIKIDVLKTFKEKNVFPIYKDFHFLGYESIPYFKDFFTKKLQLCQSLCEMFVTHNDVVKYDIDIIKNIMDLYEDVIQEICMNDNIYVSYYPTIVYENNVLEVKTFLFKNFEEFKSEISMRTIIVYCFKILDDLSLKIRYEFI